MRRKAEPSTSYNCGSRTIFVFFFISVSLRLLTHNSEWSPFEEKRNMMKLSVSQMLESASRFAWF